MAFLDDLLSNARWLDQYLGTQSDQNQNLTADETQRSPTPTPQKDITLPDILRVIGKYGSFNGISNALGGQPNQTDASGNQLAIPASAAPIMQQGPAPVFDQPQQPMQTYGAGNLSYPVIGQPNADNIDLSAAPKQSPVPAPTQQQVEQAVTPQSLQQLYPHIFQGQQNAGIGDRLAAGLRNLGSSQQMLPSIVDAIQGFTSGQRTDPLGVIQQNQRQTAIAVTQQQLGRGVPLQQAIAAGVAASTDPKIAEELFSRYKNLEEKIANTSGGGTGGSPTQQLMDLKKGEAAATKSGQLQAQAAADLPKHLLGINTTINSIDTLMNDPGLDYIAGPMSKIPNTGLIPAQSRALAQFEMLKGRAMIQGIHDLSGQGMRITQAEAMTGSQAQAALNQAQNTKDLKAAMLNYRDLLVADSSQQSKRGRPNPNLYGSSIF